jgi:hypothetical protein
MTAAPVLFQRVALGFATGTSDQTDPVVWYRDKFARRHRDGRSADQAASTDHWPTMTWETSGTVNCRPTMLTAKRCLVE